MKRIHLTQGKVALVDDADYEWLSQRKWYATEGRFSFYAARGIASGKYKRSTERMHRVILGLQLGDSRECDHIDGDGLNNRRSNLRLCTRGENDRHQRLSRRNKTGFKGVSINKRNTKKIFHAQVQVNNKNLDLGCYYTAEAAARAYDSAAQQYHGSFALTNKMLRLY